MNSISKNKQKQRNVIMVGFFIVLMALILTMIPAYAEPAVPDALNEMLTNIIFYVGLIFQTIGILLGLYAIGQMIMAYKDENPDAKIKAATLLVVAFILITLPQIIKGMNLQEMLTGR